MTQSLRNGVNSGLLPATSNAAEMMSFPLGSLESRAAARSLLIARRTSGEEGTLLRIMVTGKPVDPQVAKPPQPESGWFASAFYEAWGLRVGNHEIPGCGSTLAGSAALVRGTQRGYFGP